MNNRNFSKAVEAVSPVVATLLLVLVAAGAAIGFGVFLNGFQKKTQSNVSSEAPSEVLHIGGSSTVFELTEKAIPAWKAAHPSIVIDDQEGGSTSGIQAACKGLVDIGAASKAVPASGAPGQDLNSCGDFNGDGVKDAGKDFTVTTVGFDGVAMAYVPSASTCPNTPVTSGANQAFISLTEKQIGELYNVNGAGQAATAGIFAGAPSASGKYAWADLPVTTTGTGTLGTCSANAIVLGQRSDSSGTEDGFCGKLLKDPTAANTGFKFHCLGVADQMDTNYYTAVVGSLGNDGIQTWLKGTASSMSFIGSGTALATGSGLSTTAINGFMPAATGIRNAGQLAPGASCTYDATHYCAARPLNYITAGTPSAVEQLFLDFMLNTLNNQNFNGAAGYVSIYG